MIIARERLVVGSVIVALFIAGAGCDDAKVTTYQEELIANIRVGDGRELADDIEYEPQSLLPTPVSDGDTLWIPLFTQKGWGAFEGRAGIAPTFEADGDTFDPTSDDVDKSMLDYTWRHLFEPVKGIPTGLQNLHVSYMDVQWEQLAFEGGVKNVLDESWIDGFFPNGLSATNFSKEPVDHLVSVLTGQNDEGEIVVIVDANNDENFENDIPIYFPDKPADFALYGAENWNALPDVLTDVEFYDGFRIRQGQIRVSVNPYAPIMNAESATERIALRAYQAATGRKFNTWVYVRQHYQGEIAIGDSTWQIQVHGNREGLFYGRYAERDTRILIGKDSIVTEQAGGHVYRLQESIPINGEEYHVASVSAGGEALMLVRGKSEKTGAQPFQGEYAKEIKAITLDGDSLLLSSLIQQKKYVLLDFWGTWCAPCIEEIPYLKKAYKSYGSPEGTGQLEIVGIALEDKMETLAPFLEQEQVAWPQIWQQTMQDSIIVSYGVYSYPDIFLINPYGEIVATKQKLRGDRLAETLKEHLR